jgi:hypothetical protein
MNDELLRLYIHEALQLELRADPHMMSMLRGSGMRASSSPTNKIASRIATEWIEDKELETGEPLPLHMRTQVNGFVAKRWKGLMVRFRGNDQAAKQTLFNILAAKFDTHRPTR